MANELKSFDLDQLESLMAELGVPRFRAKQLYEWLHKHRVSSYDQMTNIPQSLRRELSQRYPLTEITMVDRQVSRDGTRKYIFQLDDGSLTEAVGMPYPMRHSSLHHDNDSIPSSDDGQTSSYKRLTVCFSTQIGCPMGCRFCATGQEGFTRNLTADEMVDQINYISDDFSMRVSNAVAMGQGEPFLNYDQVLRALRLLNEKNGLNIGARHITVSTCGIFDGIRRFGHEPEQFTLAVSLHSAIQEKRDTLMPNVRNQPLKELKNVLLEYIQRTNRRVTFEYILIPGYNDGEEDLRALSQFCQGILCHVNLLPMNRIDDFCIFPRDSRANQRRKQNELADSRSRSSQWPQLLKQAGIETTFRHSRGSDIDGACGQLKNKFIKQ